MTTDYQAVMDETRPTVEGGKGDEFIERMAERLGGKATVTAVFGEPIERNGVTVIPVARVRWGFGGGAGMGPMIAGGTEAAGTGEPAMAGGSGGGGGVIADPVGYLEIGPEGVSYRPIVSPMPSPGFLLALGAMGSLLLRGLARIIRGR